MTDDAIARLRAADPLRGELPAPLERMPASPAAARERRRSALIVANFVLLATVLFHGVDHAILQPRGIDAQSFETLLGGVAITAGALASFAFALRGDSRAPLIALLSGPWVALTVAVGHFTGHWAGEFGDPYSGADVTTFSYVLAAAVVASGMLVGVVGLRRTLEART